MTINPRWPKDLILSHYQETRPEKIKRKVEAFERFVNINGIALAILQLLSLEMPTRIWKRFPRWFRTLPNHGYPSEQIVRLTLQYRGLNILAKSPPTLLLTKFLSSRPPKEKIPETERFVC